MGRSKQKKKKELLERKKRKRSLGKIVRFNLANAPMKMSGIKDRYAYQSNMHNLIYKGAIFENINYKASNITYCNFKDTKLTGVDFINVNLKRTNFRGAILKDVIFFSANLKGVNFKEVTFDNVTFINTNLKNAKNLIVNKKVTVINSYPQLTLRDELLETVYRLSEYPDIYNYHVLHVKKNKVNKWYLYILLKKYTERDLIRGFKALEKRQNKKRFYTLYSIQRFLNAYLKIDI